MSSFIPLRTMSSLPVKLEPSSAEPAKLQARKSTGNMESAPLDLGTCKYKTGKCNNSRSYKRNGKLHQLCMFHREKANRIQRKFDRQKRLLTRKVMPAGSFTNFKPHDSNVRASMNPVMYSNSSELMGTKSMSDFPPMRSLSMNSTSSPRFSSDSDSSMMLDDLWSTIPNLPSHLVNVPNEIHPHEHLNGQHHQNEEPDMDEERMSVEEIAFFRSAMLV